jgi:predicted Zn-dependent peptidase
MSARLHRLSSGVRVVCDTSREHETFALSLVIQGGARWEDESRSGWSHLLEHMVFKGAGGRGAKALSEDIENVGGSINAATGYERTSYQVRALKGSVSLAVEVLADLVLRPTLDPAELEREKGVIASEIAEAADTPDDRVFDLAQSRAYADQPLGRPILGEVASLAPASSATVSDWRRILYAPERIVVSAAGAVDEDELLARVEAAFAGVTASPGENAPAAAAFRGGTAAEARRLEQAQIVLLLPGVGSDDPDYFAARVFAEALGGGMSSRLFQEARENRGLAYNIDAYGESYADTGLLGVYAGAAAADAAGLVRLVAEQIVALTERPTEAEVARARVQMKSGLFMARESLLSRAEQAAAQVLMFDRLFSAAEVAAEIESVGLEDVRRLGQRLLAPGLAASAVLGPKRAGAAAEAFGRALFG